MLPAKAAPLSSIFVLWQSIHLLSDSSIIYIGYCIILIWLLILIYYSILYCVSVKFSNFGVSQSLPNFHWQKLYFKTKKILVLFEFFYWQSYCSTQMEFRMFFNFCFTISYTCNFETRPSDVQF